MKFEEWISTIGINAFRHANCCKIAYEAGQQSRQAEVDEQQKRIDSIKTKSIEQALKLSSMSERNNKQAEIIKEQRKLIDELQLKVSEDSRILHNIINIERNKYDGLQARIDKALRVLLDSSPTMISKKAIKILKGGDE